MKKQIIEQTNEQTNEQTKKRECAAPSLNLTLHRAPSTHPHRFEYTSDGGAKVVGTRVLTKGASEQVVQLCSSHLRTNDGTAVNWQVPGAQSEAKSDDEAKVEAKSEEAEVGLTKEAHIEKLTTEAIRPFADKMLRTFAVAYKDLDIMPDALYNAVRPSVGGFVCLPL